MSSISRREFVYMMAILGSTQLFANSHTKIMQGGNPKDYYKLKNFGNARILHMTDPHGQLLPVHFREPSENLGFFGNLGQPPHIVGEYFLKYYGIKNGTRLAHALTCVDYVNAAHKYGKIGGYAHIKYLADYLRDSYGRKNTLFIDGGDTWQGSATSLYTRGKDMVGAQNLLGIDVMVGHWEFTYTEKEILDNIKALDAEFIAQNVFVKDEALMDGAQAYNEDTGRAFKPYTMKTIDGNRIAIIGQAFPYTTIANPQRFIPDWSFGIHQGDLQKLVDSVRSKEKPDAVILLSHNGFDVDKKLASVVSGIDFIMGGHTHDGIPEAVSVKNNSGVTYVTNAGSNGKFVSVLDMEIKNHKVNDFKFTLLPVFSNIQKENKKMKEYIEGVRKPYLSKLTRKIATTDTLLYRRGNFNGSFDQIICNALREVKGSDISLSPGFRWGTTVLPGEDITFDDLMTQTAMTYPETYVKDVKGSDIKNILEDVADNLFNKDAFLQQGGDMVRTGGLSYTIDPVKSIGHRISNLQLSSGNKIEANKSYKMSGWSTVGSKSPGEPVWDTVIKYLENHKHIKNLHIDTPDIIGVKNNPGITNCKKV